MSSDEPITIPIQYDINQQHFLQYFHEPTKTYNKLNEFCTLKPLVTSLWPIKSLTPHAIRGPAILKHVSTIFSVAILD